MPTTGLTLVIPLPDPSISGSSRQASLAARVGCRNIFSLRASEPSMTSFTFLEILRQVKSSIVGRKESMISRVSVVSSTFSRGDRECFVCGSVTP
jgi:hypothetical protein